MRVIGVDPGYDRLGFAVLEIGDQGTDTNCIEYGFITTNPQESIACRLAELSRDLKEIVNRYNVSEAGVEEIYIQKNIKTVINVAQARGVIIETLERMDVTVYDYQPQEIKIALCGYGQATKTDVEKAVLARLGSTAPINQDDSSDAVAIALCHAQSRKIKKVYE